MTKFKVITGLLIGFVAVLIIWTVFFKSDNEHQTAQHKHSEHGHAEQQTQENYNNVVSVDVKYVDGVLHTLIAKQKGTQQSIGYQSSLDYGQTWSNEVHMINADNAFRFKRGNDARLAISGNSLVAVWMTRVEGAPHNAGPMMAMRSDDKGATWQKSAMPADWNGPHGFFAMAGSKEAINLVWLDSREKVDKGSQGLRFSQSRDGGKTWSVNNTLDAQTCACCWNTVKFNNDDFYVLYRDKKPSDMALGKVDSDLNWQRISTVGDFGWDFEGCPHVGGGLAFDSKNNLIHATVTTGKSDQAGAYYLHSANNGLSWSEPMLLGDNSSFHTDIAVNNGDITVVWDRATKSGMQIVKASSSDKGITWTQAELLSDALSHASHPIIIDMESKQLIMWTESEENGATVIKTSIVE